MIVTDPKVRDFLNRRVSLQALNTKKVWVSTDKDKRSPTSLGDYPFGYSYPKKNFDKLILIVTDYYTIAFPKGTKSIKVYGDDPPDSSKEFLTNYLKDGISSFYNLASRFVHFLMSPTFEEVTRLGILQSFLSSYTAGNMWKIMNEDCFTIDFFSLMKEGENA